VAAETQPGGFSPGLATRLRLANGERVFLKAVNASRNRESTDMHRREAEIAAALPASVPSPGFLWKYDDGEWVALAFEDVEGHTPVLPWQQDELDRVLDAIGRLVATLTPSPLNTIRIGDYLREPFQGWRRLYSGVDMFAAARAALPDWAERNLERLAELESGWEAAATGSTLLHFDLRADNIIITPERVVVVDWPHASVGAGWLELVQILPSVAMQGGPRPWEIFEHHPLARQAPAEHVTAVVAAIAGYFVTRSSLPPPPGLPTVRAFQRDQGVPALEWLMRRTGWP
jgi:aminoglycoside phosphotransferase (APT) family kinase protein